MKQIVKNMYVKRYKFATFLEMNIFIGNQISINNLVLDEEFGDIYYCFVFFHALTQEKLFFLSFSSDEEDNMSVLYWDEEDLLVIYPGKKIYLLDTQFQLQTSFKTYTPLIGLYLLPDKKKLLVLEEISIRVIDSHGKVLREENVDFIENFSIDEDQLLIETESESYTLNLSQLT